MKRVFVSLCLALLCITMTSCSVFTEYAVKDGVSSKTTSSTVSSEIYVPSLPEGDRLENPKDSYYNSEAQLSLLPDVNYQESYFTVITLDDGGMMFPEESEYISVSAYERNLAVEAKYNVKIVEKKMSSEAVYQLAESSSLSGAYYADLLSLPLDLTDMLLQKGMIEDFSKKPFFVEEHPYFSSSINDQINESYDGLYALYCQTLLDPDDMLCVFYNKSVEGWADIKDTLSSLAVREDFISVCGMYGCVSNLEVDLFDGDLPCLTEEGKDAHTLFLEGRGAFCIDKISSMKYLSANSRALGVMPLPTNDEGNLFSVCSAEDIQVFSYPSGAASDKCTVLVTCALGAAGCDSNLRAANEHYLGFVQDNASAIALESIFSRSTVLKCFKEQSDAEKQ